MFFEMDRSLTFDITKKRYDEVKVYCKKTETITQFINKAIDIRIETLKTRYLMDFLLYLGFPSLAFLCVAGFSLWLQNTLFYILTIIIRN